MRIMDKGEKEQFLKSCDDLFKIIQNSEFKENDAVILMVKDSERVHTVMDGYPNMLAGMMAVNMAKDELFCDLIQRATWIFENFDMDNFNIEGIMPKKTPVPHRRYRVVISMANK
jgi:hypothetical protein